MQKPASDTKQDVCSDVPGVNPRNTQISANDTINPRDHKDADLKDRKGNQQSKAMTDGAEGEGI